MEVWKTVDGNSATLAESPMDISEIARIRMIVRDGYKLDFEYLNDGGWISLAKGWMLLPMCPGAWDFV